MLGDPEQVPSFSGLLCPYFSPTIQPLVPCSLAPNTSWPGTFPEPLGAWWAPEPALGRAGWAGVRSYEPRCRYS